MKAAQLLSAFFLGVLSLNVFQAQIPDTPTWVNDGCVSVVCTMPGEVFEGFRTGQVWYEKGTPDLCLDQSAGQSGCTSTDPDFRAWSEFTRLDGSKVVLVSDSTLYGPAQGTPLNVGIPGDGIWPAWSRGVEFTFGFSTPTPQLPAVPPGDPQAWSDWWDLKYAQCVAASTCVTGPVAHTHQFTIVMPDGSTFIGNTGPIQ